MGIHSIFILVIMVQILITDRVRGNGGGTSVLIMIEGSMEEAQFSDL